MKLTLNYKEVFEKLYPILIGVVGGKYEVKPGITLVCPSNLTYKLAKAVDGISIEFPSTQIKIEASKWLFQMDGFITRIYVRKDNITIEISNLPDLIITFA